MTRIAALAAVTLGAIVLAGCGGTKQPSQAQETAPNRADANAVSGVTTADGAAVPANLAVAFSQGRTLGEQLAADLGASDEARFMHALNLMVLATMRAGFLVLPNHYLPLGYEINLQFDPTDPAQVNAFRMGSLDAAGAYFHQEAAQTPHPELVTQEQPGERSEAAFRAHYEAVPAGIIMYGPHGWSGTYGAPEYMKWYNANLALWRQGLKVDYPGPDIDAFKAMSPPRKQSAEQQRQQLLASGQEPAQQPVPEAAGPPPRFRTPSGNITCEDYPGLRCRVASGFAPLPAYAEPCPDGSTTVAVGRTGKAVLGCAGVPSTEGESILAYGDTWDSRGIACKSAATGLSCVNREGYGFELSRQRSRLIQPPGTVSGFEELRTASDVAAAAWNEWVTRHSGATDSPFLKYALDAILAMQKLQAPALPSRVRVALQAVTGGAARALVIHTQIYDQWDSRRSLQLMQDLRVLRADLVSLDTAVEGNEDFVATPY